MGDGNQALPTTSTAPRVAARRAPRFTTRASTHSFKVQRPPIILEIGSSVIKVGYAEQFKPLHLIPLETPPTRSLSESQWYSILSPLILQVYDRLMVNPTTRRVMVVHDHYPQKSWEAALKQALWNRGVPAVSLVSSLEMVPVAQGWKRGIIVQVGRTEAVCVAHVDGHILPYTYQMVQCGYETALGPDSKIQTAWDSSMDPLWLDEHDPNSLVVALLKCLEACPRDIRLHVISNIVFTGDAIVLLPDLGRRVAKRFQMVLDGTSTPLGQEEGEGKEGEEKEDATKLTVVPINTASLKPLVSRLAVASCAPHRADFISWVGASLWAATWHKYENDETRIHWTFASTES